MATRLERWLSLMRMHGGAQAAMIAEVPDETRDLFSGNSHSSSSRSHCRQPLACAFFSLHC
jgi:hypothetical protein